MSTMSANEISLFQQAPWVLTKASGVHVFNDGNSAFIIKKDILYAYGKKDIRMGNWDDLDSSRFPVKIKYLSNAGIKALSTGMAHAVLLDNTGKVWCWGSNIEGQLGVGHDQDINAPFKPVIPESSYITCGPYITLVLDNNREVWYWGKLSESVKSSLPTKVTLPNDIKVQTITVGYDHAAILASNGQVYGWGENTYGQLGLNNNYAATPQLVKFSDPTKTFSAVAAASVFTVFVTKEGNLYMTGKVGNENGLRDTEIFGGIVSLESSWASSIVGVTVLRDEKPVVYELGSHFHRNCFIAMKSNHKYASEIFKDYITPTMYCLKGPSFSAIQSVLEVERLRANICDNDTTESVIIVADLYNNEQFSDLRIKLADGVLFAHKIILAKKSDSLKKLLEKMGPNKNELDMTNYEPRAYRLFIKYLYTNAIRIHSMNNILDLYLLAERDKNVTLRQTCIMSWIDSLNLENVVQYYVLALKYEIEELSEACAPVIHQNLLALLTTPQYNRLSENIKLSFALTAARESHK